MEISSILCAWAAGGSLLHHRPVLGFRELLLPAWNTSFSDLEGHTGLLLSLSFLTSVSQLLLHSSFAFLKPAHIDTLSLAHSSALAAVGPFGAAGVILLCHGQCWALLTVLLCSPLTNKILPRNPMPSIVVIQGKCKYFTTHL